jgi:hypothetical protein
MEEGIITSSSFMDMLENDALLQLSDNDIIIINNNDDDGNDNNNSLTFQLDGTPRLLAHIAHDCLNMNFLGQWIG